MHDKTDLKTEKLLRNRTFHIEKLRTSTILNTRGFYQLAAGCLNKSTTNQTIPYEKP